MSSVPKSKRSQSKEEFDAKYYSVYYDCVEAIETNFHCKDQALLVKHADVIKVKKRECLEIVEELLKHLRLANSIFPTGDTIIREYSERRTQQDLAIGCCEDLLTQYVIAMRLLKIDENKYVYYEQHIKYEINSIKKWRQSDNKIIKPRIEEYLKRNTAG